MIEYVSHYANQNHQLMIAVSKHWHVRRDGRLQWQKKPMEVALGNCAESDRTHVVNYIVRDHYSGVFFAAIGRSDALRTAEAFLSDAWAQKAGHPFVGPPQALCIAKTYLSVFPSLPEFLRGHRVRVVEATSGFYSGVRDARTWEASLDFARHIVEHRGSVATFDRVSALTTQLSHDACDGTCGRASKFPRYQRSLAEQAGEAMPVGEAEAGRPKGAGIRSGIDSRHEL